MGWFIDAVGLLCKGGFVMVPLIFCSVISVAVLIERFVNVKKAQTDVSEVVHKAEDLLYGGRSDKAIELLESTDTAVTRVLAAGICTMHLGDRCSERAMEEQGTKEVSAINHRLGSLDTIITIAPLLGLLGTVTGMISAFHVIAAKEGISTPTAITGGVAEALIATATGLAVAIFTVVGYNHLQERIKGVVAEIEIRGTAMLNVLVEIEERGHEVKRLSA